MSKYKVTHELEDRFIVTHPDGSEFTVAKKGLGKAAHDSIRSLAQAPVAVTDDPDRAKQIENGFNGATGFANGGVVPDPVAPTDPSVAEKVGQFLGHGISAIASPVVQGVKDVGGALGIVGNAIGDTVSGVAKGAGLGSLIPEANAAGLPATGAVPAMPPVGSMQETIEVPTAQEAAAVAPKPAAVANPLDAGFKLQEKAITENLKAQQDFGKANEAAEQTLQGQLQASQERYTDLSKKYQLESDEQIKQMAEGKIDPNRVWNNTTTGQKISTGIALLLGGLAGGANRTGVNPAAEMLQKAIDRDIESQKANLTQKNNVFSANLRKYGNQQDAEIATRKQLLEATAAKLEQNKNKAVSATAKANADQALGTLKTQIALVNQQMAAKQSVDPLTSHIMQLPQNLQSQAWKEKGIIDKRTRGLEGVKNAYTELAKIGGLASIVPFSEAKAKLAVVNAGLIAQAMASVKGNPSESEFKNQVKPYLVSGSDTVAQIKQKEIGMDRYLKTNADATPILDGYGLSPKPAFVPKTQKPR